MITAISIYIFSVFIASIAQILLKKSANKKHKNFVSDYFNRHVFIAYLLFLFSTIPPIISLRTIPLKGAPILSSLSYVFIYFFSYLFLGEKITAKQSVGYLLIIVGIISFYL